MTQPLLRQALAWLMALCALSGCTTIGQAPAQPQASAPPVLFPQITINEPKAAPALAPEITVKPPAQIWPELRAEMSLPHHLNNRWVKAEIRWMQRNRDYFMRLEPRFSRYQAYITKAVRERNMPAEIALLPLVESALNPYAMSPDGAHGLWQFMPATAGQFGLKRDWWQDARRDPILATDAALDYLEHLHRRFGDWLLAVAAYNTGEGNLRKALRRAKRHHGHEVRDFFALRLPRETRSYVPRLLAVSAVVSDPSSYGLELPFVRASIPFRTVQVDGQYDLTVAAKAMDVDASEIRAWNPALKQWATPPVKRRQSQKLIVPLRLATTAQAALDAVPAEQRLTWHRWTVRRGDTLSGIARRFGTSVAALRSSNNLRGDMIRANSVLRVPAGEGRFIADDNPRAHTYRVRRGDSLWRIGRKFGVSHKTIMRVNGIGPRDVLRVGQRILVPLDGNPMGSVQAG